MTLEQLVEIIGPEVLDRFQRALSGCIDNGEPIHLAHQYAYSVCGPERDAVFAKAKAILALQSATAPVSLVSPAGDGWELFSTAPRDGDKFDVWYSARSLPFLEEPARRLVDVYWSTVQDTFCIDGTFGPEEPSPIAAYPLPSHWRRRPAPPVSAAVAEGQS